jgi:soluble lytic murein transglycosylase-like protein
MRFHTLLLLLVTAAAWPRDAQGQIHAWRDANGTLVISDHPINEPTVIYPVGGSTKYVTTTPVASESARDRYEPFVVEHSTKHGLRPELVRAVIQVESAYNPRALSPKGAMGLMQLMPATARDLGVVNPFHPAENIRGGVVYLARLLARYDQNLELALAAYNAGPGAVERYGAVPPYRETQSYVRKIANSAGVTARATPPPPVIYKWVVEENGSISTRYSNVPPKDIAYQVVGRR